MAKSGSGKDPWEYCLRKYLLLLATLVATVTYTAAFNPPGGIWQDANPAANRIAGDPIIRDTSYSRYLVFFYSNATAFASSLVVIVLILILAILHDRGISSPTPLCILRGVMVLDLLSLMAAYAAGTFRDKLTAVYSSVLAAGVIVYLLIHTMLASRCNEKNDSAPERLRKVLMLLATFAVSVTYLAGLSAPGGFWDHAEGVHRPGDAVLKGGPHDARLKAFFVCNTTAFVASLLILVMLLEKKLSYSQKVRSFELYGFIAVTLIGLVAAYAAGSCRQIDTTIYVSALIGAVLACIFVQVVIVTRLKEAVVNSCFWAKVQALVSGCLPSETPSSSSANCSLGQQTPGPDTDNATGSDETEQTQGPQTSNGNGSDEQQQTQGPQISNGNGSDEQQQTQALEKARSLVLLLATLAAAITYQAGLNPPGGLWQDDGDRYKAGDPILLTTNPRRYKAFYYSNSVAFVASLVAIILVRKKTLHQHNALEAAMILDLFGLIGAYAAGSCRDVSTSIYAMALAGAALVYVVIHVVFFTLDHTDGGRVGDDEASRMKEKEAEDLVGKRRKRLLLFAILAVTITYQAGLTPPSGFHPKDDDKLPGHRAGDSVLLYNYPRRYMAFFYCNSVTFMLSIALIILLVNPNLYRPAIRSNALSVCTAVGLIGIMGAYAAGSTQHLKTSIYIFVLAAVVLSSAVILVVMFFKNKADSNQTADVEMDARAEHRGEDSSAAPDKEDGNAGAELKAEEKKLHAKRKYLMLLGILVASVTYQTGLAPPGGVWQANVGKHAAGDPVMHDNRRPRYLVFFYSNSTSFVASIVVILLLLPESVHKNKWWLGVMNTTIVLDLIGLLVAYAAGSSRSWKTSIYVSSLVIAVLGYFAIHVMLSCFNRRRKKPAAAAFRLSAGGHQASVVPA